MLFDALAWGFRKTGSVFNSWLGLIYTYSSIVMSHIWCVVVSFAALIFVQTAKRIRGLQRSESWGGLNFKHQTSLQPKLTIAANWKSMLLFPPACTCPLLVWRCKLCKVQSYLFDLYRLLKYSMLKWRNVLIHILLWSCLFHMTYDLCALHSKYFIGWENKRSQLHILSRVPCLVQVLSRPDWTAPNSLCNWY